MVSKKSAKKAPAKKTKPAPKPQAPAPRCPVGPELLHDPALNKGTAFTQRERDKLGLRGLLPPHIHTQQEQVTRVLENFHKKPTPLEKYIYMVSLQDRNET